MNKILIRLITLSFAITVLAVNGEIPINPAFTKDAVENYERKAKDGDPDSQYLYAWALHEGLGCKKDLMLSYEYASKAAMNNVGEAFYLLAIGNNKAWNAHRDCEAGKAYANKYYLWAKTESETSGSARAHCALARCYNSSYGVKGNIDSMIKHYSIAAEKGSNEGAERLCDIYTFNAQYCNRSEALKWAHLAADRGSVSACETLGDMYGRSGGKHQDYNESLKWQRKAADGGSGSAMFFLGHYYANGLGAPKDLVEALSWYKRSAEAGFELAYDAIALCYFKGEGTEKNESEGVRWLLKAIKDGRCYGETIAPKLLSDCYRMGIGVHQDPQVANRWSRMARGHNGVDLDKLFGMPFGDDIVPLMRKLGIGSKGTNNLVSYELGGVNTPDPKHKAVPGSWDFCLIRPEMLIYDTHNKEMVAIIAFMPQEYLFNEHDVPIIFQRVAKDIKEIIGKDIPPKHEFIKSTHIWTWDVIDKRGRDSEICVKASLIGSDAWRFSMMVNSYVPKDDETTFSTSVSTGTGWLINKTDVVTCWHVVKNGKILSVELKDGIKREAKIVARDIHNDIAVLRISGEALSAVPIKLNTKRANVSDRVFTFGYPLPSLLGQTQKYTDGVISSLTGVADDARYYQISVPIQPGNSGGALVDKNGEAIGMTTSALDALMTATIVGTLPQNVNYAVKSRYIAAVLEDSDISYNENYAEGKGSAIESASDATVLVIAEL